MATAPNSVHVVHRTTVELRKDPEGNLSVYVDEPEGVPLFELVGLLEMAKASLVEHYSG